MSGAYAHITLANQCRPLIRKAKISQATGYAVSTFLAYAELGAISPDYPYLGSEGPWADLFHHERSAEFFRNAVSYIKPLKDGPQRQKLIAWLMGYAAHVAGDVTIHPIVNNIVGPYEQNKAAHRECEMHQDSHVFQRLNVDPDSGATTHLTASIASCSDPKDADRLDPMIAGPWLEVIRKTYPEKFAQGAPSIDKWHAGFGRVLNAIRTANRLLPFARHLSAELQVNYPRPGSSDPKFLRGLPTPVGGKIDYDPLFDRAMGNAMALWEVIDASLSGADPKPLQALQAWNLDTGLNIATGKSVYWEPTP